MKSKSFEMDASPSSTDRFVEELCLCQFCEEVVEELLRWQKTTKEHSSTTQSSSGDLLEGAKLGCSICSHLASQLDDISVLESAERSWYCGSRLDLYTRAEERYGAWVIDCFLLDKSHPERTYCTRLQYPTEAAFRPVEPSNDSKSSFDLLRGWVKACDDDHACLVPAEQRQLPTRLVDLGGSEKFCPKLCLTHDLDPSTRYTTLSHCWGGLEFPTLRHETLEEFIDQLPKDELPPTIQHAFKISRQLDCRYIWIDCLCIVQDDSDDWHREAAKMSEYYQNSWLGIRASRAKDGRGGCFATRDPTNLRLPFFVLQENSEHKAIPLVLYDFNLWDHQVQNVPLGGRGWAVQEQLLAPRMIHCSSHEFFWECICRRASETFPQVIPLAQGVFEQLAREETKGFMELALKDAANVLEKKIFCQSIYSKSESRTGRLQELLKATKDATKIKNSFWETIVEKYSATGLTYPEKDKLIAISGLARAINSSSPYFAGGWMESLHIWLSWRPLYQPSRSIPYQAPSWSWASINSPVRFHVYRSTQTHVLFTVDKWSPGLLDPRNEFGAVKGSQLEISGPLLALSELSNPANFSLGTKTFEKYTNLHINHQVYRLEALDFDGQEDTDACCLALTIQQVPRTNDEMTQDFQLVGLLLSGRNGENGTYQRVGFFQVAFTIDEEHQRQKEEDIVHKVMSELSKIPKRNEEFELKQVWDETYRFWKSKIVMV